MHTFKKMFSLVLILSAILFAKSGIIISGGLNRSDISGDGVDSMDMKKPVEHQGHLGVNLGVQYELGIAKAFSALAGIALETRGFEYRGENVPYIIGKITLDDRIKMLYLIIPIDAKGLIPIGDGGIYASFGPRLGILLSAKADIHEEYESTAIDSTANVKDDFKAIDFGLGFKVGGEFGFGVVSMLINIGYDFGLVDINNVTPSVGAIKNSNLSFNVGFRINRK